MRLLIRYLWISLGTIVLTIVLYCCKNQKDDTNKQILISYIPELKDKHLTNIKIVQIKSDHSYRIPYLILVQFRCTKVNIFQLLNLKTSTEVDSSTIRKMWIDERKVFFEMNSLNAMRFWKIEKELLRLKWRPPSGCSEVMASPYNDSKHLKHIVSFGDWYNGRVACCQVDGLYYLLIECWG